MNERKPIKSLMDLKMTTWYASRKPIVKDAINNFPPGYYIYTGNNQLYRLIGWSEPETKLGEEVMHIFLEREIVGGTERLRVHPSYIVPEGQQEILEEVVDTTPYETISVALPTIVGYNVGKEFNGEIKYLMFEGQRRVFVNILAAQLFLVGNNMSTEEQLNTFVYEPYYE